VSQFKRFISRGRPFTGKQLLGALQLAGTQPRVGRGLRMSGLGPRAVIGLHKRQIIPRGTTPIFEMAVVNSQILGAGRWVYDVEEVRPTDTFGHEFVEGGLAVQALNRLELNNTSQTSGIQGYGYDLDDPNATITIQPVRDTPPSIVQVTRSKTATGEDVYWFYAENPLEITCQ
jgi:hypothetical protein